MSTKIRLRLLIVFKTNLKETPIYGERFLRVLSFVSFSQENEIALVDQIWHSKVLKQYSMARNISFRLLTDFKSQFTGNSNLEIKLLESLKVNLLFPGKIILYSWTKLGILKPWAKIPWSRRFELGFWQTSKQFDRKLQYTDNFFGEIPALPRFVRKMILYSSSKFGFLKPEPIFHGPKDST